MLIGGQAPRDPVAVPTMTMMKQCPNSDPNLMCRGAGGGLGVYSHVPGDLPVCIQQNSKHEALSVDISAEIIAPMPAWENRRRGSFVVIAKNCRSLRGADRFDELITDLRKQRWDVVLVNETWRSELEEMWTTEQNHTFIGSGHASGRRGVGILIHRSWTKSIVGAVPVSERLCYIDLRLHGNKYRFISVYFPDSTYPDAEVQKLYDQQSEVVVAARKAKLKVVIGGDFNARVGGGDDTEAHPAAGRHGYGEQDSRGQWLLAWETQGCKHAVLEARRQADYACWNPRSGAPA